LTLIQSAIVFTLAGKSLGCGGFLAFGVNLPKYAAMQNPTVILSRRGESETLARYGNSRIGDLIQRSEKSRLKKSGNDIISSSISSCA